MDKYRNDSHIVVERRHTQWGLVILLALLLAVMAIFLSKPSQVDAQDEISCNWNYVCEPGQGETYKNCPSDCDPPLKADTHCSNFNIAKKVPQALAVPFSFVGSANIDSAEVYFKKLGFSLSLYLYQYDWVNMTWHGYLNTTYLPLGKHHGRVNTYDGGLRGFGCETGGFKVVND